MRNGYIRGRKTAEEGKGAEARIGGNEEEGDRRRNRTTSGEGRKKRRGAKTIGMLSLLVQHVSQHGTHPN